MQTWLTNEAYDFVAAKVCREEKLEIISDASTGYGWCCKVLDSSGQTHYLKIITEDAPFVDFKRCETKVLALGQADGIFPKFRLLNDSPLIILVADPGNAVDLRERYLRTDELEVLGGMFKKLHSYPLVPGVKTGPERTAKTDFGPPMNTFEETALEYFKRLGNYLVEEHQHENVLLHGDPHPANIVCTDSGRLYLIDPHGVKGSRCYDMARLASYELDPIQAYQDLLRGYGVKELPDQDEWLAFSCFQAQRHRHKLDLFKAENAGPTFTKLVEKLGMSG